MFLANDLSVKPTAPVSTPLIAPAIASANAAVSVSTPRSLAAPNAARYMWPTQSSQARDSKRRLETTSNKENLKHLPSSCIIHGEQYRYIAGRPVCDSNPWPLGTPGFMRSTASAEKRVLARWESGRRSAENRRTRDAKRKEAERKADARSTTPGSPEMLDDDWGYPPVHNEPQPTIPDDDAPVSFKNWIRQEPALANCFQNHPLVLELINFSFALAKESLWHWARENEPEFFRRLSPHGPTLIRASFRELEVATRDWRLVPNLRWDLIALSRLRNFIAHPEALSCLADYNHYIYHAEGLIWELGDKVRLGKLREAREALRVEAEKTLTEIEEREALAALPGGDDVENTDIWAPNHEALFRRVLWHREWSRHDPEKSPPLVARVAERWGEVNVFKGSGD